MDTRRLRSIAMIAIFDIGGPLLAYNLLGSNGFSTVAALVLSGVLPAAGVIIGIVRHRRADAVGVLVLAGIVVGADPRAGQPQPEAGARRGVGLHRRVRADLPGLAGDRQADDVPVRAGVHRRGHRARPRVRGPAAVPGVPARVRRHHRGLGQRLPGGGGRPGDHRAGHLGRDRADGVEGAAVRGGGRADRLDDRLRPLAETPGRADSRRVRRGRGGERGQCGLRGRPDR